MPRSSLTSRIKIWAGGDACPPTACDRATTFSLFVPEAATEGAAPAAGESLRDPGTTASDRSVVSEPAARLARPAVVRPVAPARYQVQMTVSAETHAKFRHAQDLLRHVVPTGDPAILFDRALTLLVQQLERTRCAAKKERTPEKPTPAAAAQMRQRSCAFMTFGGNACWPEEGERGFHTRPPSTSSFEPHQPQGERRSSAICKREPRGMP